jgi:hypothetical protein
MDFLKAWEKAKVGQEIRRKGYIWKLTKSKGEISIVKALSEGGKGESHYLFDHHILAKDWELVDVCPTCGQSIKEEP